MSSTELTLFDHDDAPTTFSPAKLRKQLSMGVLRGSSRGVRSPLLHRQASAFTTALALSSSDESVRERFAAVVIVAFLYFDKKLDMNNLRQVLRERLLEIPRFCCTIKEDESTHDIVLDQVPADRMDMTYHLQEVKQDKPWDQHDIDIFTSKMYGAKWDTSKPQWYVRVVQQLTDGRSCMVMAINHAQVDGTAAIAALMAVLDEPTKKASVPKSLAVKRPPPSLGLVTRVRALLHGVKVGLFGSALPADPDNSLKVKNHRNVGLDKTLHFSEDIPLERVKALKLKYDNATVTDVLLSTLTVALRKYFDSKGEPPSDVRANFPVNMRSPDEKEVSMGNKFASANFTFSLQYPESDLDQVIYEVKDKADFLKLSPGPKVEQAVLGTLVPFMTRRGSVMRGKLVDVMLDIYGKVTAMLSSNRGPSSEVSLAGQAIKDIKFYALGPIGVYVGILSYNGRVSCTVAMDATCGKAEDLTKCWKPAFESLCAAADKHKGTVPRKARSSIGFRPVVLLLIALAVYCWTSGWSILACVLGFAAALAWA